MNDRRAELSNTESVHEDMEKQSFEYGNGCNVTLCFLYAVASKTWEMWLFWWLEDFDHGYLYQSPFFINSIPHRQFGCGRELSYSQEVKDLVCFQFLVRFTTPRLHDVCYASGPAATFILARETKNIWKIGLTQIAMVETEATKITTFLMFS